MMRSLSVTDEVSRRVLPAVSAIPRIVLFKAIMGTHLGLGTHGIDSQLISQTSKALHVIVWQGLPKRKKTIIIITIYVM